MIDDAKVHMILPHRFEMIFKAYQQFFEIGRVVLAVSIFEWLSEGLPSKTKMALYSAAL
jgi:hypothetical protein